MNNKTCVILVLFFAFVSCTLSSYLDIPPPPERPIRFKTKEQIETYLKSVKDYYDAFKIKLVRRNEDIDKNKLINEDLNDQLYLFEKLYHLSQPSRRLFREQEQDNNLTE